MRESPCCKSKRGITLALVIMFSFMLIAFFAMVTSNRQIENASAGGVTARLLANGAMGAIHVHSKVIRTSPT